MDEIAYSPTWIESTLWIVLVSFVLYFVSDICNYLILLEASNKKEDELGKKIKRFSKRGSDIRSIRSDEELKKKFEKVILTDRIEEKENEGKQVMLCTCEYKHFRKPLW